MMSEPNNFACSDTMSAKSENSNVTVGVSRPLFKSSDKPVKATKGWHGHVEW